MNPHKEQTENRIASIANEKGDRLQIKDFSKPELEYLIKITALSYDDSKMAFHYFVEGRKVKDVMELVCWYSTNTFYRHKKIVAARLIETARNIAKFYE